MQETTFQHEKDAQKDSSYIQNTVVEQTSENISETSTRYRFDEQAKLSDRPKLVYLPWSFARTVKNIYPEYDFIPLHKAIFRKREVRALVGYKGRDTFWAKLFGFPYWALKEGFYSLSGHKPCSFTLEQFGDYKNAHNPSEWEEWMLAIPVLLDTFSYNEPVVTSKISMLDNSIKKIETAEFSSFMRRIFRRLPSAFPALSPHGREDTKELLASLLKYRLSSDRYAPDVTPYQLSTPGGRKRVLILDEARLNKRQLHSAVATEQSFLQMFEAARKENSGAAFFLLEPKSVRTNKKKGYLRKIAEAHGVKVLNKDVSSISVIEQADIVYTVSSHLGMDAIFLDKKIRCFGMPFYAGWGLTHDAIRIERRNVKRSKEEFFAALTLYFTRYKHPITGESGSFQDLLRFIILQRPLQIERDRYIACIHFDDQLMSFCKRFFSYSKLDFLSQEKAIRMARENKGMIFTAKEPDEAMRIACASVPLVYVNGGALDRLLEQKDYVSLCLEGGAYPSLERILQTVTPSENDLLRARLFRQYLREISAFRTHFDFAAVPEGKDVILLVGNRFLPTEQNDYNRRKDAGVFGDICDERELEVNICQTNMQSQKDTSKNITLKNTDAATVNLKNSLGGANLDAKGHPLNSLSSPLADDTLLIQHVRAERKNAYIIYCPQVENMHVSEEVLSLVDEVKPYARPSDFVPLTTLGIATDTCSPSDYITDESVECLPQFQQTDFTKWSRKHVSAKRFLEKAHNMTTVNGQFCPIFYPLTEIDGHKIEMHTNDSFLGLDALAVDMPVYTYGWPFYAGWGLTIDAEKFPKRTRTMNVERLFAAAFILQPRYFDTVNDIFCEPENSPYLLMRDNNETG